MKDCLGNPLKENQLVQLKLNNGALLIGRVKTLNDGRVLQTKPGKHGPEPVRRPGIIEVECIIPAPADRVSGVCDAITCVIDPDEVKVVQ